MAQRMITTDDITGEEDAATRVFVIDDQAYQIDLTDDSYSTMIDALSEYIDAATRVTLPSGPATHRRARGGSQRTSGGAGLGLDTSGMTEAEAKRYINEVRAWGRDHGMPCADKGRVPKKIIEAWYARGNTAEAEQLATEAAEERDAAEQEEIDETPPVPVTDKLIVEWAKAKGYKVVGDRCTATLRTRYRTDNPGRVLAYDISKGAKTA